MDLTERSAAQAHFLDLCELVGHPKPQAVDPKGEWFTFEKGAAKHGGGDGWADVWKKDLFGWEYKGRHMDLRYNEHPARLDLAHKKLDAAVAAAYGWPADLSDDQILERLLGLNLERAAEEAGLARRKEVA